MNLTDVPLSGIYYQQGAIVDIVVQMIDQETGLPINLGAASGLSISILYPNLTASQTFVAELYSDGADGRIVYKTRNDGVNIDLSQVGLYQMQGGGIIGGTPIPPSYNTDFYVLPNVFGGPVPAPISASALILFDSAGIRWAGTVSPGGVIGWVPLPFGPASFLYLSSLVMKDDLGIYWTLSINTLGIVTGVAGGTFPQALDSFILTDINGHSWVITVSETGGLVAA